MTKTTAPKKTPSPVARATKPVEDLEQASVVRTQFLFAILNLSWKLAVVVLAPLLLGSYLDSTFDMYPVLTLVGFVIAMIGVVLVVWRQIRELDSGTEIKGGEK